MSTIKTGIIASEGIAIGRAYLFVKEKLEVDTRILEDAEIEEEVLKIQKAIEDYSKDLENMEVSTDTQQEVINAHLGMLDDPF